MTEYKLWRDSSVPIQPSIGNTPQPTPFELYIVDEYGNEAWIDGDIGPDIDGIMAEIEDIVGDNEWFIEDWKLPYGIQIEESSREAIELAIKLDNVFYRHDHQVVIEIIETFGWDHLENTLEHIEKNHYELHDSAKDLVNRYVFIPDTLRGCVNYLCVIERLGVAGYTIIEVGLGRYVRLYW